MRRLHFLALALAIQFALVPGIQAQTQTDWPTKPVKIVVPFSAGGSADVVTRVVAEKLGSALGQTVVVENRTGAAAIVGTNSVAKAAPDGYTLLAATPGPIVFNSILYSQLPYAPAKELAPVVVMSSFPMVLVVQDKGPLQSLKDVVSYTTKNPDKSNYGSSAASTRLAVELLKTRSGIRAEHIPFKGSIDANNAVVAGDVTMSLSDVPTAAGLIRGKRLHPVAVTSGKRIAAFPDVPTLQEQGIDLQMKLWVGLFAPAGTPPAIISRIEREVGKILTMPDVQQRLASQLHEPEGTGPVEFGRAIAAETELWGGVARAHNIKAD